MVTEPLFENADLLEQWNCEADALLLCGGSSVTGIRPLACCRPALESSIAHTMQAWYPQQREPISSLPLHILEKRRSLVWVANCMYSASQIR